MVVGLVAVGLVAVGFVAVGFVAVGLVDLLALALVLSPVMGCIFTLFT